MYKVVSDMFEKSVEIIDNCTLKCDREDLLAVIDSTDFTNAILKDVEKNLIKKKQFLEHAKVFKNYYGSSKKLVLSKLKKGKNVIFDIDWQGTKQIKQKKLKYKLITFFILPPSRKILYQRLSRRDMGDKLIVEERMQQFDKDILNWKSYDFVVINDDLDLCYKQIIKLIKSKLLQTKEFYNRELIKNHIKFLKK